MTVNASKVLLTLSCVLSTSCMIAAPVPVRSVTQQQGLYVRAADLESSAGIAIKQGPDSDNIVACTADRCAIVPSASGTGGDLLIELNGLADVLGLEVVFDDARQHVTFELNGTGGTGSKFGQVGSLAPDFRLTKLDGSSVALSDFRGKRVLINSWASW